MQNARATATKMGFVQYEPGFGPEADDDTDVAATIDAEPLSFVTTRSGRASPFKSATSTPPGEAPVASSTR